MGDADTRTTRLANATAAVLEWAFDLLGGAIYGAFAFGMLGALDSSPAAGMIGGMILGIVVLRLRRRVER